jgi:hypothetical protein
VLIVMGVVCLDPGVWLFAVTSDERVTAVLRVVKSEFLIILLLSHSVIIEMFCRANKNTDTSYF